MIIATGKMRQAYLMAALDVNMEVMKDGAIARSYVGEKLEYAFKADYEEDLLCRLDLQRQGLYYKYLRGLRGR